MRINLLARAGEVIYRHVLRSLIDGPYGERKVHGTFRSFLGVKGCAMSATDANLSNRNFLSSIRSMVINVFLSTNEELNLLAKDYLIVRKDLVVTRHVE